MIFIPLIYSLIFPSFINGKKLSLDTVEFKNFKIVSRNDFTNNILLPEKFSIDFIGDDNVTNTHIFNINKDSHSNKMIPRIYFINNNDELDSHDNKESSQCEFYSDMNKNALATVCKNKITSCHDKSFELLITFDHKNETIIKDLKVFVSNRSKRNAYKHFYRIDEKKDKFSSMKEWFLQQKLKSFEQMKFNNRFKTNAIIKTLVLTDYSVFNRFKQVSKIKNRNLIFDKMRLYYTHLINGVNQIFYNSFKYDKSLKIEIKLVHFLFLTEKRHQLWIKYQNKRHEKIVLGSLTLDNLTRFMNTKYDNINFDHAMGFLSNKIKPYEGRSESYGISWTPGICEKHKYSLINERGDLSNIPTAAHELAHNLNVHHDDKTSCGIHGNFIMNAYSSHGNINHVFSPCSIKQMKSYLLNPYGFLKERFKCLMP